MPARATLLAAAALALPATAQSLTVDVNHAIDRGVRHLLSLQTKDGSFATGSGRQGTYPMGCAALVTYTLLQSGVPADDPIVERAVAYLRSHEFKKIYSVGCLALVLHALGDPEHDPWLRDAARWIEDNLESGTDLWAYPGGGGAELSNTQYAVLGLWAAEKHGYEVAEDTWRRVIEGTLRRQNKDGGFFYRSNLWPFSSGTMTCAGVACLEVAVDALEGVSEAKAELEAAREGIERGLAWLDRRFTVRGNPAWETGRLRDRHPGKDAHIGHHYYYLYGIERVAAFSDRSRFGGVDWYRAGAFELLENQTDKGDWANFENTCFALLFLKRATWSGAQGRASAKAGTVERWRYSSEPPELDWAELDYDDSDWAVGRPGFGNLGAAGQAAIRTEWTADELWVRREFEWSGEPDELALSAVYDDAIELYLNGVLAFASETFSAERKQLELTEEARAALVSGKNVLAAYVRNKVGDQSFELWVDTAGAFAERFRAGPAADAPFVRRWLVAGPSTDTDHMRFFESLLPDEEAAPIEGQKNRGLLWREAWTPNGTLNLSESLKARTDSIYYAFTWIHVAQDTELLLWIGSGDGLRVFLDGSPVYSMLDEREHAADADVVSVHLRRGAHRLLCKLSSWEDPPRLSVRVTDGMGAAPGGIEFSLSESSVGDDERLWASPWFMGWAELRDLLPPSSASRIDFAKASDLAELALGPATAASPRWHDRARAKDGGEQPPPGGKGYLVLEAPAADVQSRMVAAARIPRGRTRIEVDVAAEAYLHPGQSGARVRVGLWQGDAVRWVAEATVQSGDEPKKSAWTTLGGELGELSEEVALVILDVERDGTLAHPACVFVDEIRFE